jgi:hypothetical protein
MTAEITVQYNVQEVEVTPSGVNVNVTSTEDVTVIAGVGTQGPQGIQGIQGEQGIQGIQGIPGVDGQTILYGAGTPSGGIGQNGDFYINTNTYFIYGPKTAGVWNSGTSLIGPQGPQGLQGSQGIQGLQGPGVFNREAVLFSGTLTISASYNNNLFVFTGDGNLILPDDLTTLGAGFEIVVRNDGHNYDAVVELADPQDSNILFGNGTEFYQYYLAPYETITIAKMDDENYCITSTSKEVPDNSFPGMALLSYGVASNGDLSSDPLRWDMPISPRWANLFVDDFSEYYSKSYVGQWGTGASVGAGTTPGHPGLAVFNTGTTSSGGGMVAQPINNRYVPQVAWKALIFEACVSFQDLSTSGEEYIAFFGFNDKGTTGSAAHPSNGLYFFYDRVNTGGNFIARVISGGVATDVTTNQTIVAGTWYRLRIFVYYTGFVTYAVFSIGNSTKAFITTNIPGSGAPMGYSVWMNKKAGTTNRIMYCDYYTAFESQDR